MRNTGFWNIVKCVIRIFNQMRNAEFWFFVLCGTRNSETLSNAELFLANADAEIRKCGTRNLKLLVKRNSGFRNLVKLETWTLETFRNAERGIPQFCQMRNAEFWKSVKCGARNYECISHTFFLVPQRKRVQERRISWYCAERETVSRKCWC